METKGKHPSEFRVVALLTVRNEEDYIETCLRHLLGQGVEICLIDNESTDRTVERARAFMGHGLISISSIPYDGCFELSRILENEECLAAKLDASWYIHHDADELRYAPRELGNLKEAIRFVDSQGFNAINFDEFVFLPIGNDAITDGTYEQKLKYYYYFSPQSLHRVNAWKNVGVAIDLKSSGGHHVNFANQKIYPQNFVLKHYIALSRHKLLGKYVGRVFSAEETYGRHWHGARATLSTATICLPSIGELHKARDNQELDVTTPMQVHPFLRTAEIREIANLDKLKTRLEREESLLTRAAEAFSRHGIRIRTPKPVPILLGFADSGLDYLFESLNGNRKLNISRSKSLTQLLEALVVGRKGATGDVTGNVWNCDGELVTSQHVPNLTQFIRRIGLREASERNKFRWGADCPALGFYLDQLSLAIPETRFIHVIRDGRNIARPVIFSPSSSIADVEDLAVKWMNYIRQIRQLAQLVPFYVEVRYEELIRRPQNTLTRLSKFLHIAFDRRMVSSLQDADCDADFFYGTEGLTGNLASRTRTSAPPTKATAAVNQVIQESPVATMKLKVFEAITSNFLSELGYERTIE